MPWQRSVSRGLARTCLSCAAVGPAPRRSPVDDDSMQERLRNGFRLIWAAMLNSTFFRHPCISGGNGAVLP
eukprot:4247474-Pyramimonas_sp.AAC.1